MKSVRKEDNRSGDLQGSGSDVLGHHAPALTAALVLTLSLITASAPCESIAESVPQQTAVAYQDGTITDVHETNFEIDGRTYGFTPDAVIVDEEGNPMEPSSVLLKAAVKFHVKNDQRDKIDRMVLVLPK